MRVLLIEDEQRHRSEHRTDAQIANFIYVTDLRRRARSRQRCYDYVIILRTSICRHVPAMKCLGATLAAPGRLALSECHFDEVARHAYSREALSGARKTASRVRQIKSDGMFSRMIRWTSIAEMPSRKAIRDQRAQPFRLSDLCGARDDAPRETSRARSPSLRPIEEAKAAQEEAQADSSDSRRWNGREKAAGAQRPR